MSNSQEILKLIVSAGIACAAFAANLMLRGYPARLAERGKLPRLAVKPLRLAMGYFILLGAVVLIVARWGMPVSSLVGGIGAVLGLVAIGFVAMWSMLSNFLCTFVLIVFNPFSAGDEIEIPGNKVKGRVTDLNLIFTTLETAPDETILVPNNIFFQQIFRRRGGKHTVSLEQQFEKTEPHRPHAAA